MTKNLTETQQIRAVCAFIKARAVTYGPSWNGQAHVNIPNGPLFRVSKDLETGEITVSIGVR